MRVFKQRGGFRTPHHRARWAAVGAAIAVTLGSGGLAFVSAADEPDSAVFDTVSPVRIFDTRTGDGGVPDAPLGAGDTLEFVVAGSNGVPADATAVVMNVTAVGGTERSFLTIFPTGETQPVVSSVNWDGPAAAPNAVISPIGAGGKVSFFNEAGTVNLFADVTGYYTPANRPPFTPVAVQATSNPTLPDTQAVIESLDITLPDVCPGAPDSWTVEVQLSGYFLTGLPGGFGSATTGISLDGIDYEASTVLTQNFDSTVQFREPYARTALVTLDAGTHTINQLGSKTYASTIFAAQNALIAQSVTVSC